MSDKIYCGSGKRIGTYGTVAISVCLDDIPAEYKRKGNNGKTYISLNVNEKREADQYGKTHSVTVDTWKPENAPAPRPAPRPTSAHSRPQFEDDDLDSMPF